MASILFVHRYGEHMKSNTTNAAYTIVKSPIDELMLVADDSALIGVSFAPFEPEKKWKRNPAHPILKEATQQLHNYFAGKRNKFSIPMRLEGTEFQKKIWTEIARIPYGKTISYSDLARRAGNPDAIRAAGTSTGRNPIAIIIPCHRVVGKNGDMCGFGGGLPRKKFLLNLENPEISLPL
jgi:methylated-DNA-[protein]-cysteine S-methyltransferase